MSLSQVLPPPNALIGPNPITVNKRTYQCNVGSVITVPDWDARQMEANGWLYVGSVDTTANRPILSKSARGQTFLDSTLAALIVWDGVQWRNQISGAVV